MWTCNLSRGIRVMEQWSNSTGRVRGGLMLARPFQAKGLNHATWAKALGFVVLREEGIASGWFHRAATTSRPWQWKDYGLAPLRTHQGPMSWTWMDHYLFVRHWVFALSSLSSRKFCQSWWFYVFHSQREIKRTKNNISINFLQGRLWIRLVRG